MILSIFSCAYSLFVCLWRNSYLSTLVVCLLLLSCKSLYIFWVPNIWFSKIFSYSVGCLLTFLVVFPEAQKILIKRNDFNFDDLNFGWVCFVSCLRNHCLIQSLKFILFCKRFIVLALTRKTDSFWLQFCVFCEIRVHILSFACG